MSQNSRQNNLSIAPSASPEAMEDAFAHLGVSLPELRAGFQGQVILPGEAGYDPARTLFYGGYDQRPALIAQAAGAADVQRTIALARQTGLELAVRSGGHSVAGFGLSDGGIVLDLSQMRALEIDVEARTAWAETGLTASEYTSSAGAHGLATGFGDTGSVGIGGITLGGGVGLLVRKYGLTIDDLLAAEVVTADGQILQADAQNHPDLFWAIRGGGGNFGAATRFKFRLHEVGQVMGGVLILPVTSQVITGFMDLAQAAPEELSTIANIMSAPPMPFLPPEAHGKLIVMALMVYAGDIEAGREALAPFRALAQPIADMLRPMPYPEIYPPEEEDYHPTAASRTMFLDELDSRTADTILRYLQESDASLRAVQLRALGGAMARVPVEATAFAHRHSKIMANLAAFYEGPEEKAVRDAWVEDFAAAIRQQDHGAYVNFIGPEGSAAGGRLVREAYPGRTWQRLREIKARYDPDNLFHLNQNIPPAGFEGGQPPEK